MKDLTVIIPIHEYNEEFKKYLLDAVESTLKQTNSDFIETILIVSPEEVRDNLIILKELADPKIKYLINPGKTDYCNQINLAAKEIKTKYFSVLGFDDQYNLKWFDNVEKYIKNMPEISVYLPIINFVNKEDKIVATINEIIWAMAFVKDAELGVIDNNILQKYYDFSVSGGVFRTDDFIECGMLKPSINLCFWYEYLLRATNEGLKVFVIPKNGYYQTIEREGSLLDVLEKTMDVKERAWWIKLATKEYYFKKERKSSYVYTPEKELSEVEGLI
jgi:hypothetical protein